MSAYDLVKKKDHYGLISGVGLHDRDYAKYTVVSFELVEMTGISPRHAFENYGWKYYPGVGFVDREGNIAEAFKDGEFVAYPNWKEHST